MNERQPLVAQLQAVAKVSYAIGVDKNGVRCSEPMFLPEHVARAIEAAITTIVNKHTSSSCGDFLLSIGEPDNGYRCQYCKAVAAAVAVLGKAEGR